MFQPPVYDLPPWGPLAGASAVAVEAVRAALGGFPAHLDPKALSRFAGTCGVPLVEADIEADVPFPNARFAHRDWVRAEYAKFRAWCQETGWLGGDSPTPPAKRRKREPVVA